MHWNPSIGRTDTNYLTFSSDRKTASVVTGTTGAFGLPVIDAGKVYFEVELGAAGTVSQLGVTTVWNAWNSPAGYPGIPGGSYDNTGVIYQNGGTTSGFATFTNSDVIGVYVDADNGDVWFSKNGVVIGGDPHTGTSPQLTGLSGEALMPHAFLGGGNSEATLLMDSADWNYTPGGSYVQYGSDGNHRAFVTQPYTGSNLTHYTYSTVLATGYVYLGQFVGGPNYNFFYIPEFPLPEGITVDAASWFIKSSGNYPSNTVNFELGVEDTTSPTLVSTYADTLTVFGNKGTVEPEFLSVSAWTLNTVYEFTGVGGLMQEVINQTGRSQYDPLYFLAYDHQTSPSTSNIYRRATVTGVSLIHYLDIEYSTGDPVTHSIDETESLGLSDSGSASLDIPAEGTETLGFGDSGDASPFIFIEEDTLGFGEFGDASLLKGEGEDTIGFSDEGDAYTLNTDDTDSLGLSDEGDAYILSVSGEDTIGFGDEGDATSVRIFSTDPVYFYKRIRGGILTLNEVFDGELAGSLPIPAGSIYGPATASGGLPIPAGVSELIYERVVTVSGYFPMPAGTTASVVEIVATVSKGLPIPVLIGDVARWEVITVDGGLPIPAGVIEAAIEPGAVVSGSIPLPSGGRGILIEIDGRFAILTYTRCS